MTLRPALLIALLTTLTAPGCGDDDRGPADAAQDTTGDAPTPGNTRRDFCDVVVPAVCQHLIGCGEFAGSQQDCEDIQAFECCSSTTCGSAIPADPAARAACAAAVVSSSCDVSVDDTLNRTAACDAATIIPLPFDGGADAGADDAGANDAGGARFDSGLSTDCGEFINLAEATNELPFAIPDTFTNTSPSWMRPVDMCPAAALTAGRVPFVAYTYCNGLEVSAEFTFGMQAEGDIAPVLVAYSGEEVPADPRACSAIASSATFATMVLALEPGEVVTIVSTSRSAGLGDIVSIAEPN